MESFVALCVRGERRGEEVVRGAGSLGALISEGEARMCIIFPTKEQHTWTSCILSKGENWMHRVLLNDDAYLYYFL